MSLPSSKDSNRVYNLGLPDLLKSCYCDWPFKLGTPVWIKSGAPAEQDQNNKSTLVSRNLSATGVPNLCASGVNNF